MRLRGSVGALGCAFKPLAPRDSMCNRGVRSGAGLKVASQSDLEIKVASRRRGHSHVLSGVPAKRIHPKRKDANLQAWIWQPARRIAGKRSPEQVAFSFKRAKTA